MDVEMQRTKFYSTFGKCTLLFRIVPSIPVCKNSVKIRYQFRFPKMTFETSTVKQLNRKYFILTAKFFIIHINLKCRKKLIWLMIAINQKQSPSKFNSPVKSLHAIFCSRFELFHNILIDICFCFTKNKKKTIILILIKFRIYIYIFFASPRCTH